MYTKRILLSILITIFFCLPVFPEYISFGEAELTALNWADILRTEFKEDVTIAPGCGRVITRSGLVTAYVFDFENKGFIIISAEDYLPLIKFYTTSFDFAENEHAVKFQDLIFANLETIISEVQEKKLDSDQSFGCRNREFFRFLKGYHRFLQDWPTAKKEELEPLLRTGWGQVGAESLKCPVIEGYRAPTGCVATAIAQVMRYHEWPQRGRGSHAYTLPGYNIYLSANFDHEYDWENMLDYYEHKNFGTEKERKAISTLMFDIGVSLEMYYTPHWSSVDPQRAVDALPKYFKYSEEIDYILRFGYSDDEWFEIARDQLNRGLPIPFTLSGSPDGGHEAVIDGYRILEESRTVHINFGWYGLDDGYYSLDEVLDFKYLPAQAYLIDMKPPHYRYIKAPGNISGVCYKNQSLLMTEYHIYITWGETPTGEKNIEKYIIYRKARDEKERDKVKIAEIEAGKERVWKFITPHFDQWEYEYTVIAVDAKGNKSKNPQWIRLELSTL